MPLRQRLLNKRKSWTGVSPVPQGAGLFYLSGATKKEASPSSFASSLLGTAEGTAGLGNLWLIVERWTLANIRGDAVALTKPATEVDEAATFTAKWELGPFGSRLPLHRLIADWTAHTYHRMLSLWTLRFFPVIYSSCLNYHRRRSCSCQL
jgi:hypothetical protein